MVLSFSVVFWLDRGPLHTHRPLSETLLPHCLEGATSCNGLSFHLARDILVLVHLTFLVPFLILAIEHPDVRLTALLSLGHNE
jgi:hypothetical protein